MDTKQKTPLRMIQGTNGTVSPAYNFNQVVRVSGLSDVTLEREILAGNLKVAYQESGGRGERLFTMSDVSDFLAARKTRKAAK